MTYTRLALGAGIVVVLGFIVLVIVSVHTALAPVVAIVALFVLIGLGNLLYGRHSHGAAATARVRPAQEAQNRAIDEANESRRRQRREARSQRRRHQPGQPGHGQGRRRASQDRDR